MARKRTNKKSFVPVIIPEPTLIQETRYLWHHHNVTDLEKIRNNNRAKNRGIVEDIKGFFSVPMCLSSHIEAQTTHRERYAAALVVLTKTGNIIAGIGRSFGLAAALVRHDYELLNIMLNMKEISSLRSVTKAVTMLDSGRKVRGIEKRVKRLKMSGKKIATKDKLKIEEEITTLMKMKPKKGSVSGSVCRCLRRWARQFTKTELEEFSLHQVPKDQWKDLADICHFNPGKDFALPWFLPYCFGVDPPESSIVAQKEMLSSTTVNDMVAQTDIPFSLIRDKELLLCLTKESKLRIAEYSTLEEILRNFHHLETPEVDAFVSKRLEDADCINMTAGETAKIIMRFRKITKGQLQIRCHHDREGNLHEVEIGHNRDENLVSGEELSEERNRGRQVLASLTSVLEERLLLAKSKIPDKSPVVVLTDGTQSWKYDVRWMLMGGLLAWVTGAKIGDINEKDGLTCLPQTLEEMLDWIESEKYLDNSLLQPDAVGDITAALQTLYERQEVVKTFIIVGGYGLDKPPRAQSFVRLFKKYHDEVYPADVIVASFIRRIDRVALSHHFRQQGIKDMEIIFHKQLNSEYDNLDVALEFLSSRQTLEEKVSALEDVMKERGLTESLP